MDRRLSQTEQRDITRYLGNFPGTSIQYIEEERVTTFLVVWGDNEEPEFARDIFRQLEQKKQQVRNLLEYFDEYGDYYDWWCWFDTADELYEYGH